MSAMDYENELSDSSDFSDEDVGMLKKALHVEFSDHFDPNKLPADGEEYLQQVIYEAKRCPQLKVAPINPQKITKPSEVQIMRDCIKAPKSMIPSMAWQDETIENFIKLRKFISTQSGTYQKKKEQNDAPNFSQSPLMGDVISLLQQDKVKMIETLLTELNQIKKGESINQKKGMWAYALLATIEIPLCPDTCHILREFARKCSGIRSQLPEDASEEEYVPLNLFICLIARFFRQLDLAD